MAIGFSPLGDVVEWRDRNAALKEIKNKKVKSEAADVEIVVEEKPATTNTEPYTIIPPWLPPIYTQHVREPMKRDLVSRNTTRNISISEIVKSRYLRIPDNYFPEI